MAIKEVGACTAGKDELIFYLAGFSDMMSLAGLLNAGARAIKDN